MPRATYLIRGAAEELALDPDRQNDVFKQSGGYPDHVNSSLTRINKRYFMITTINVEVEDTGSGDTTSMVVPLNVRPDARGQIHRQFTFIDNFSNEVSASLVGHIDWDKGNVNFSVSFSDVTGFSYSVNYANCKCVFSPRSGEVGRVKVNLKISGWDINIDTHEDFEIELETETIQDYKDIYNVDQNRSHSIVILNENFVNC